MPDSVGMPWSIPSRRATATATNGRPRVHEVIRKYEIRASVRPPVGRFSVLAPDGGEAPATVTSVI